MVEIANRPATNGTIATNGRALDGQPLAHDAERAWQEAKGASQIAPLRVPASHGIPGILVSRPLREGSGDQKARFRRDHGRGCRFLPGQSRQGLCPVGLVSPPQRQAVPGRIGFPGTITCEYHGYTFDGQGECVAGLIEDPNSPLIGKMKVRSYPTEEYRGVVYMWMGETDPVPLEEDLPPEILDSRNHWFLNRAEWDANWTEPVNQGLDYHEAYLHRKMFNHMGGWRKPWMFKFHGLLQKELPFFRPRVANYGGIKITYEDEKRFGSNPVNPKFGEEYHAGVNDTWPKKRWYQFLPTIKPKKAGEKSQDNRLNSTPLPATSLLGVPGFAHGAELPSKIRTGSGGEKPSICMHMRWMVPITFDTCRVWTYTIGRRPKTPLGRMYKILWYWAWRRPSSIIRTNQWEDLVTFQKGRLRFDLPQKLGILDSCVIYFRRHLALRSRDYQRLGGAYGSNHPPTRTGAQWKETQKNGASENIPQETKEPVV